MKMDQNPYSSSGGKRAARLKRPALLLLHQQSSSPGEIGRWLRENGYEMEIRRPPLGDPLPANVEDYGCIIDFGGPQSANDENPEIRREIAWLEKVAASQVPFLGMCLGAQMMARALGASITPRPDRLIEIGCRPITPTAAGLELVGQWPEKFFLWHNEGFSLPAGAVLLASGENFPNQAFSYEGRIFGLQFHPEVNLSIVRNWAASAPHMLEMEGADSKHDILIRQALCIEGLEGQHQWLNMLMNHLMTASQS